MGKFVMIKREILSLGGDEMKNILLVEDDQSLNRGISFKLKKEGYQVYSAYTLKEADELFSKHEFQLIVTDINLPDGTGFEFCERIREKSEVYLLMLTALDQEIDVVTGYDVGADDYVTKPFSLMILMSKINAVMRRVCQSPTSHVLRCEEIEFDYVKNELLKGGESLVLSKTEGKLLRYLMDHSRLIVTKEQMLEALWDIEGQFVDENTIAVNIRRLRQKVENDPSNPQYIKNVRGVGYTFAKRCLVK